MIGFTRLATGFIQAMRSTRASPPPSTRRPLHLLVIAVLLLAFSGEQSVVGRQALAHADKSAISLPTQPVRVGDLVFRLGRSLGSRAVISVDPTSPYSHVGILVTGDHSEWRVVHVMPQAVTDTSPAQFEPLTDFISADQAAAYAFYRFQGADSERVSAVKD